MSERLRNCLHRQFESAWQLCHLHLDGLDDEVALWRPAEVGLHVIEEPRGWIAQWPEHEDYTVGPASIAWLTWHIGFWWSMTLDHSFGEGTLARSDVMWPGSATSTLNWLEGLHDQWVAELTPLNDDDLADHHRTRWPFSDRPFSDVIAWVNSELMKNAAEIGYVRFLYGGQG